MRIGAKYSHLNGFEFLMYHKPHLWKEFEDVVKSVDAEACRTKLSEEKRKKNEMLLSPREMNKKFAEEFEKRDWKKKIVSNYLSDDSEIVKQLIPLPAHDQKEYIVKMGGEPIRTTNETDFVKDRIAVEVQFGKYSFVAHDLFVKHISFFIADEIDVGIEVVPMKAMMEQMSSGVPYFQRDLFNVLRQGRGIPAVPIILVGLMP